MPLFAWNVIGPVLVIAAIIVLGTGVLIAIAIGRRFERERYFRRLDALREAYGPTVTAVLAGELNYERALDTLSRISGPDRISMLERLCLERKPTPAQMPVLRRLCQDLGLVEVWQRDLVGRFDRESVRESLARPEGLLRRVRRLNFLVRARSAENLRLIGHQRSWPLLVQALSDPHPDVQATAARALAALGEPQSFPALVKQLRAAVLGPFTHLSTRSVKAALVSFPLKQASDLLPLLRHPNPRIRFLTVDVIREMVEREAAANAEGDFVLHSEVLDPELAKVFLTELRADEHPGRRARAPENDFVLGPAIFAPELAETFLTELGSDENPDVRARAAAVIAWLPEGAAWGAPRSTAVLSRLLSDTQWFVRLHAVRALAKLRYARLAVEIAERLKDSNWRVREAAARTLLSLGPRGVDRLIENLASTRDAYSRDQIIEELERSGLIPALLSRYASEGLRGRQAIEQLVNAGKTSRLMAILETGAAPAVRDQFARDFARHPNPKVRAWVRRAAGH